MAKLVLFHESPLELSLLFAFNPAADKVRFPKLAGAVYKNEKVTALFETNFGEVCVSSPLITCKFELALSKVPPDVEMSQPPAKREPPEIVKVYEPCWPGAKVSGPAITTVIAELAELLGHVYPVVDLPVITLLYANRKNENAITYNIIALASFFLKLNRLPILSPRLFVLLYAKELI
jgi:hypothetical protein